MNWKVWASFIPVLCCSVALLPQQTDKRSAGEAARTQPESKGTAALPQQTKTRLAGDPGLADLAQGMDAYQRQDFDTAAAKLSTVHIPQIADYVAYYLAAARVESKQYEGIADELAPVHHTPVSSPLAGKAWLLEAKALEAGEPEEAVKVLRDHYAKLPQPDGNLALGDAYVASNDDRHAAEFYQRVYSESVTGDAAQAAETALAGLKAKMGSQFPPLLPEQAMERGDHLLEARQFRAAKDAYVSALPSLVGTRRDEARVRIGRTLLQEGNAPAAMSYLRALDLPPSEADAERLYWEVECARRTNDETAMAQAVEDVAAKYPQSRWRLKATVGAADHWLAENRPDQYLPLYQAACDNFPDNSGAALYHWRIVFQAYLHDQPEAARMLREQLENFPTSSTAAPALYFLGRYYERQGEFGNARACYDRLERARPNQFYAVLARQRLEQPEVGRASVIEEAVRFADAIRFPEAPKLPVEESRVTALRIERSRLLRGAGLNDLADAELRFGTYTGGQPVLLGMEIGENAPAAYQALRAMKATASGYLDLRFDQAPRRFWEMLFPMPYRSQLEAGARANGVDSFLLAGLIRQESEFNPGALSHANAYGLTQVLPVTAQRFARRVGITRFSARQLFEPATSLKIGSAVLRWMLDQNGGKLEQTLAAYNAGPRRAAQWAGWGSYREPAEFIESIPYNETREYVQAVLRNADIYRRLYRE